MPDESKDPMFEDPNAEVPVPLFVPRWTVAYEAGMLDIVNSPDWST